MRDPMTHSPVLSETPEQDTHVRLSKNDRPRSIDRFIDFFGTGSDRPASDDACGERLLEVLGDEDDDRETA